MIPLVALYGPLSLHHRASDILNLTAANVLAGGANDKSETRLAQGKRLRAIRSTRQGDLLAIPNPGHPRWRSTPPSAPRRHGHRLYARCPDRRSRALGRRELIHEPRHRAMYRLFSPDSPRRARCASRAAALDMHARVVARRFGKGRDEAGWGLGFLQRKRCRTRSTLHTKSHARETLRS
jgi:hypothetical protein